MNQQARDVARLWTLAQPAVSAFVASMVRDFKDRDDVLQDVAVAVFDSFLQYDAARPFNAWAIGVARNQVLLYLRRKGRDRLVFDPQVVDRLEEAFAAVRADEIRRLDYLEDCIRGLEGRAVELFQLRYRDDLKPGAIASRVGMSANSVAKALQRMREVLRDCVDRKAALEGL